MNEEELAKAWEEYYAYIEKEHGKIPTIYEYFNIKESKP
jgi:hypothetical protein